MPAVKPVLLACVAALALTGTAAADDLYEIAGLEGELLTNAEAFLGYSAESCDSPSWRLQSRFARGAERIREALEAYGYYDSTITESATVVDGCLRARFSVDPGPPVLYRSVEVRVDSAEDSAMWQRLVDASTLQRGGQLRHAEYDTYKQRFTATARRYGYFDAGFTTAELLIYPEDNAADIRLHFSPGPRYRFGATVIRQDVVSDDLVTRFIEFDPGDPFNADVVAELYDALLLTNYFGALDVRSSARDDGSTIADVIIEANAAKPTTWTAGLGFGTDTGPQFRLGYLNRRSNRSGHQWGVSGSASRIIKQAGINYRIPLAEPRAEWLSLDAGYRDEDTETLVSRQLKTGIKRLQRRGSKWLEAQFIDVVDERYTVGEQSDDVFYIAPGISWSRTKSSSVARPAEGFRLSFQVSGTAEAIGSSLSFLQSIASAKIIHTLPLDVRVLARADVGATWVDEFQELPASLRFFAGGDFSVRGYDYKTLGPSDGSGEVVGGENLLTMSIEADRIFHENWAAAVFVDAGNAFNDASSVDLQVGAGAGVRWFSPVGPIRFDIAFPFSTDAPDDFRLHISLSPDL